MQMERIVHVLIFVAVKLTLTSCGKGNGDANVYCKPQNIAIAECIVEQYEKNPNQLMIEYQRQYCQRLYPINMCYYR
jgi:hypothetical protein